MNLQVHSHLGFVILPLRAGPLERPLRRLALFFGRSLAECPGSRRAKFRELFPRTQGKEKATASSGLRCRPTGTWRETTREDVRKYNDYKRQRLARNFRINLKTLSLIASARCSYGRRNEAASFVGPRPQAPLLRFAAPSARALAAALDASADPRPGQSAAGGPRLAGWDTIPTSRWQHASSPAPLPQSVRLGSVPSLPRESVMSCDTAKLSSSADSPSSSPLVRHGQYVGATSSRGCAGRSRCGFQPHC